MAVHLFCDVVLDRRLRYIPFLGTVIGLWTLNFSLASIGLATHPHDFYKRAGMWCWINEKYMHERIWFHYLWVLTTEFGTILLYSMMFIVIWRRVRTALWASDDQELRDRAMNAARTVIAYPIAYVICTLPIVVARLGIMAGRKVGVTELAVAGFFLTSNGWVDVLLYTTTRRSLIFGPPLPQEAVRPLDTFEFGDMQLQGEHSYPYGAHGKIVDHSEEYGEQQLSKEKGFVKREDVEVTTQDLQYGSVSSEDVCEGEDIIRAENVAQVQKEFRDFTAELAAVWRPRSKGREACRPPPRPLDWEQFERVCDEHGRHRERYSHGAGSKDSNDSMASAILPPPASAERSQPQRH
ncbi:family A G -coupled receptor [Lecanosticta acicola]|uniref:Family A G -coupled receptor, partial n=1 Tax=Lecanosticta acicola TaxID=111012 RepID=A0AAI8Z5J8_9PEZI|nr:family A G -coupled receptor [Lecanosticta acicola]